MAWPDQRRTLEALDSLDLLVSFDVTMSQTAKRSSYVFASAMCLETPGYQTSSSATVGYANDQDKVNEVRRVILAQHQETPAAFHDQYVRLMAHPAAWKKFQVDVIQAVEDFQNGRRDNKVDTVGKASKGVEPGKVEKDKQGK